MIKFKEEEHPRDEDGEFIDKGESTNPLDLIPGYRDRPQVTGDGYLTNPAVKNHMPAKGARDQVQRCAALAKEFPDGGTALLPDGILIKIETGYQFSFMRPAVEISFTDEEYDEICNYIMKRTGSRLYAGFWAGSGPNDPPDTEPSFWCEDGKTARQIAALFNQNSILNWKALNTGIGDIYIDTPHTDGKKIDKSVILANIRENLK